MTAQDKVNALTTNLRRLWPRYDTDLNQHVQSMPLLLQLFENFFFEAKLVDDYNLFRSQLNGSIEELIYATSGVTAEMLEQNQRQIDKEIVLNQQAIINIVKQLYGMQAAEARRQREAQQSNIRQFDLSGSEYVDHYQRVKTLAKEKNWNQDKINRMLSDREAFAKEFNLVSPLFNF